MSAYHGPYVVLTHAEAAALLPAHPKTAAEKTAATKIRVALASDPRWKEPLQ